jgi:nucleoid-associated protein EbfC
MFKNLTSFAQAMKNLAHLGPQVQKMQEKLESARIYGSGTDAIGAVHLEMTGLGVVTNISISPALTTGEHHSLLEQLTCEAMNQANQRAREMHIASIQEITGGADLIPGLNDLLKKVAS